MKKIISIFLLLILPFVNLFAKDSLYVFISTDCPVCISQTLQLREIYNKYNSDFNICLVFPNFNTSKESIEKFNKLYKIKIPYLIDSTQDIAKSLKISTIPEVVLKSENEIKYRGRIDNSYFAPGRKRTVTTEFDLKNALEATLNKSEIKIKETNPIGCILTYKKRVK